jgi:hypothetical protein
LRFQIREIFNTAAMALGFALAVAAPARAQEVAASLAEAAQNPIERVKGARRRDANM